MREGLMQHVLLATYGSESARRATEVAAKMSKAMGSKLSILTVGEEVTEEARQFAPTEGSVGDALEGLSSRLLHQAKEIAQKAGVGRIDVWSAWGDPAEVIIEIARREKVGGIVVGRRGRGRLAGLLLGSVSQKLVGLAPCTVVVVP
jgi:nucleotide-binding universal stress UspA family protein